jgi:hypothetical protein
MDVKVKSYNRDWKISRNRLPIPLPNTAYGLL